MVTFEFLLLSILCLTYTAFATSSEFLLFLSQTFFRLGINFTMKKRIVYFSIKKTYDFAISRVEKESRSDES